MSQIFFWTSVLISVPDVSASLILYNLKNLFSSVCSSNNNIYSQYLFCSCNRLLLQNIFYWSTIQNGHNNTKYIEDGLVEIRSNFLRFLIKLSSNKILNILIWNTSPIINRCTVSLFYCVTKTLIGLFHYHQAATTWY